MKASPYRVGIDIVHVQHVQDSIERFGERFLQRIFTQEERNYCLNRTSDATKMQSFAARFAAKEATLKVLRPGETFLDWRTIEVHRAPEGWCEIELHGASAALAATRGITALSLSLSHELDLATAVVVADFV